MRLNNAKFNSLCFNFPLAVSFHLTNVVNSVVYFSSCHHMFTVIHDWGPVNNFGKRMYATRLLGGPSYSQVNRNTAPSDAWAKRQEDNFSEVNPWWRGDPFPHFLLNSHYPALPDSTGCRRFIFRLGVSPSGKLGGPQFVHGAPYTVMWIPLMWNPVLGLGEIGKRTSLFPQNVGPSSIFHSNLRNVCQILY